MNNKVLIIDDEQGIRDLLKFLLQPKGFIVSDACGGIEGIEIFKKEVFDIVILDIHMPNMNGMEVLKVIKQIKPEQIVIITSSSSDSDFKLESESTKLGVYTCLYKPFNTEEIIKIMQEALSKRKKNMLIKNDVKVLIIDDEQGIRDMISYALQKEGYTVKTAQNGKEGIQKVDEQEIDIVITDIKMPGIDGIEVLEKIKEIKPEIEVIVATGYGTMETAIESLRKGAYDYINKPFNINELSLLIAKAYETKQLKSQLVSLKELDKLKAEFLSMITHELRTPLMAISGALEIIMSKEDVDDEGKLIDKIKQSNELLEIIKRNTERIRALITDMLDCAKIEAGCWKLENKDTPVIKIMKEAVKETESLASNKKIDIVQQVSLTGNTYQAADIMVNCDYEQIKRVLTNFLTNSIKYTQESGKIAVWFEKTNGGVKFTVEDNGMGIAKENLEAVFDRFYRINQTFKKDAGGFGLGLSICKKIIELHNGKIWVESEGLEKGSKFIFTLPIEGR
ncbi:MAG: response regulator [Elusimicrobia bacterium]|nr:response regulator [Candidatus Liberimonas magnetica]